VDASTFSPPEYVIVTYYVYDSANGNIILSHQYHRLKGRSTEIDEQSVLTAAAKRANCDVGDLSVLTLHGEQQLKGAVHKVDVNTMQLITVTDPRMRST
jgi:hypothetical protein